VPKELHVILLDNGRLELLKHPVFQQIGQCIRCASCLNVCPVYGLVGGEVYGKTYPGGIGALLTAFLSSPGDAEKIQELCLNCGKCREICPGKIDIPGLILQLRSHIRSQVPPPLLHKLVIDMVLPRKSLLDISLKAAAPGMRFFPQFPTPAPGTFRKIFAGLKQEISEPKGLIAFFCGCMIDYVYPEIGESIVLLLNRAGYRVELPVQNCCGAPALYTGLEKSAKKMAKENLLHLTLHLENYDHIVTACPTGTAMLKKHWRRLLADDPAALKKAEAAAEKTVDFIQLFHTLQKKEGDRTNGRRKINITYHYSCHLRRSSGIEKEPREVLSAVPGVHWIEMDEADRCCGFAGTYSMKLPEISLELLERKIENIEKSGAEIVLTDCPGCLLSLRNGLKTAGSDIRAYHTAVFLANK
jgi:Fe-S oxidoreductase